MREFTFVPPNRGALWSSLQLNKAQLASLAGMITRQISPWTRQGYLTAAASTPGRYNGDALDVCVLIKQALDARLSLQRAVALARAYLTAETLAQPDARTIPPTVLPAVAEHLWAAEASLAAVRQVVEALAPPERAPDERVARRDE